MQETGVCETIDKIRQKVKQFLIEEKGYSGEDIEVGRVFEVVIDNTVNRSMIDFVVRVKGKSLMIIKCSSLLASRERGVLSCARIFDTYQIPFAIITDGENAEVLDTLSGEIIGLGLEATPSRQALQSFDVMDLIRLPEKVIEKEKRIFLAFDTIKCPGCNY